MPGGQGIEAAQGVPVRLGDEGPIASQPVDEDGGRARDGFQHFPFQHHFDLRLAQPAAVGVVENHLFAEADRRGVSLVRNVDGPCFYQRDAAVGVIGDEHAARRPQIGGGHRRIRQFDGIGPARRQDGALGASAEVAGTSRVGGHEHLPAGGRRDGDHALMHQRVEAPVGRQPPREVDDQRVRHRLRRSDALPEQLPRHAMDGGYLAHEPVGRQQRRRQQACLQQLSHPPGPHLPFQSQKGQAPQ